MSKGLRKRDDTVAIDIAPRNRYAVASFSSQRAPEVAAELFVMLNVRPATSGGQVVLLREEADPQLRRQPLLFIEPFKNRVSETAAVALRHDHDDRHFDGQLIKPTG